MFFKELPINNQISIINGFSNFVGDNQNTQSTPKQPPAKKLQPSPTKKKKWKENKKKIKWKENKKEKNKTTH